MAAVRSVLAEVGADSVPAIEVFNKCDRLDDGERARLNALYPGALVVSALTGDGRDELIAAMEGRLALDTVVIQLEFDAEVAEDRESGRRSCIASAGSSGTSPPATAASSIEAEVPRRLLDRFAARVERVG